MTPEQWLELLQAVSIQLGVILGLLLFSWVHMPETRPTRWLKRLLKKWRERE